MVTLSVSKPFITLGQPVASLLYPVSDSIGWNRIFSRKLGRRDVILKDLLHDFLLLRLSDGVLVERRRWSVIQSKKKS